MDVAEFLSQRLAELEKSRAEMFAELSDTRDKLAKADAKRTMEIGDEHFHKWSDIYRELESRLDQSRIRLSGIEAEIAEKTHKLEELREKARAEYEHKAGVIRRINSMPVEEMARLSRDELAILQEYETGQFTLEDGSPAADVGEAPAERHESPAVKGEEPRAQVVPPAEIQPPQGGQQRLLQVLQKIARENARDVTLEEFELLLDFHAQLLRRGASDPSALHQSEVLAASIRNVDSILVRLHNTWAERVS